MRFHFDHPTNHKRFKHMDMFGDSIELFMTRWGQWLREFPGELRLVTMAVPCHPAGGIQFRIWRGEPNSISPDYVDSAGNGNLIAHIGDRVEGNAPLYRLLAEHLLQGHSFTKETVNGVEVWRIR